MPIITIISTDYNLYNLLFNIKFNILLHLYNNSYTFILDMLCYCKILDITFEFGVVVTLRKLTADGKEQSENSSNDNCVR